MKKLKVVKYDSLMTKENNYETHEAWTMSRAFKPKNLEWTLYRPLLIKYKLNINWYICQSVEQFILLYITG